MPDLRVTLIQADAAWHDAEANRVRLSEQFALLEGQTDLIVLPEMFTTGFSMQPELCAEQAMGPTVDWLREWSQRLGTVITGSVATRDGKAYYNRLLWMRPNGVCDSYDKRHLFRMAREQDHFAAGSKRLIVDIGGWRVCPLICYDLRFPVWSRRTQQHDYDLLIYVANWPASRRYAWQTLLRARAIENISYCVGVNRVGTDGVGLQYSGDSVALDFLGQPLCAETASVSAHTVVINRHALEEHRARVPAHLDADEFELRS
jgi:omega-amidase